jgi:predicted DNA-binding transcriptional regulator YafY
MPTNKNAQLRYQVLDRCLSNWSRRYYIEDLIEACNEALYQYNGDTKEGGGVKKRQVQEDLKFIESEEGYQMVIDAIPDGHRKYYRYHDRNASIKERPINQEEVELMHNALVLLQRFQGVPHFRWLDGLTKQLDVTSKFGKDASSIVSFQENPYLKGMDDWYQPAFNAIVNKRVIDITYHPFGKEPRTLRVYPYHLKQYNNRWFLIAKQIDSDRFSNYAIDRIEKLVETSKPFKPLDEDFDFDEFFSDVVGVSIIDQAPVMDLVLKVKNGVIGYIETKPLHESQTQPKPTDDGRWEVHLKVKDNYELLSLLRSFGDGIEVIAPADFRQKMKDSIASMTKLYED